MKKKMRGGQFVKTSHKIVNYHVHITCWLDRSKSSSLLVPIHLLRSYFFLFPLLIMVIRKLNQFRTLTQTFDTEFSFDVNISIKEIQEFWIILSSYWKFYENSISFFQKINGILLKWILNILSYFLSLILPFIFCHFKSLIRRFN